MDKIKEAWKNDPIQTVIVASVAALAAASLLNGAGRVIGSTGNLIHAARRPVN